MIVHEHYDNLPDGAELIRTFSDEGKYIRKVGTSEIYEEAIDYAPAQYTYEETEDVIPPETEEPEDTDAIPGDFEGEVIL